SFLRHRGRTPGWASLIGDPAGQGRAPASRVGAARHWIGQGHGPLAGPGGRSTRAFQRAATSGHREAQVIECGWAYATRGSYPPRIAHRRGSVIVVLSAARDLLFLRRTDEIPRFAQD